MARRFASLRTLSNIERGDLNTPIDEVAQSSRGADIQARGPVITQLVYMVRSTLYDAAGRPGSRDRAGADKARADLLRDIPPLAAVRRWQITDRTLPRDLAAACREVRLKAVPLDPYSGQPMKLALVGGQPFVYSVGKDAKDAGGKIDSKNNTRPGDLIYRLSPAG